MYSFIYIIMFLVASLNCNGLINQGKRRDLFTYLAKNKYDLVLLQETFWDQYIHSLAKLEWDGEICSSFYTISRRRGISCLVRKGSDIDIHHFESDNNGRFLDLHITVDEQPIRIINIYAPNSPSDRKLFFEDIARKLHTISDPIILAGDFNNVLNTLLDKYPVTPHPDSSRKTLKHIMSQFELVDIWRERHPSLIQFTRTASNHTSASRIDRFLIHKQLVRYVKSCSISRYPDSDHDLVELKFDFSLTPRGPGVWIFNNSILEDAAFCSEIRDLIQQEKLNSNYDTNLLQWYDQLKSSFKSTAHKFAKIRSRLSRSRKKKLTKQIRYERTKAQKYPDYDTTRLRNLEDQLSETTRAEIKGAALRSRITWFEEGERSSNFFLNLEKSRQNKKVMRQILTDDGIVISEQQSIIHEQVRFYSDLYSSEQCLRTERNQLLDSLTKTLSEPDSQSCEGDISAKELHKALFDMESNKSPGLDGLTVEFYKEFWDVLYDIFLRLTKEIYQSKAMCNSMKTGLITLIPKKGDLRKLKNWRPISLLNTDYKIITKALANRISNVINSLVSEDQTCCIPGRDIADNVLIMRNIIEYVNDNNRNGYVLKIDQLKAFDRVNHNYIFDVLKKMGFGNEFINWIKILYTDIHGCIKHNGYVSDTFHIQRGVRQGCPISVILYVLSAEPFHDAIYRCKDISGIEFMNHEARMFQHADDTTFLLSDISSIKSVQKVIYLYEKASGSKCNVEKTELLVLGQGNVKREEFNFPIRKDFIEVLGVCIGNDNNTIETENWKNKTDSCCNVLKRWKGRNPSFKGKALVINSLVVSRLTYLATILPVPRWVVDSVKESVVEFMWGGKKPAISYTVLLQPVEKGGLNLCDFDMKKDALRMKYISKLLSNNINPMLKRLMLYFLNNYENMNLGLHIFSTVPQDKSIRKLSLYYQEMLRTWKKLTTGKLCPPDNRDDILMQPLFHNPFIVNDKDEPLFIRDFIDGGIILVSDLMYEMIPRQLPAEGIHETITMTNPDCSLQIDDVSDYVTSILGALPSSWLEIIYSDDRIVSDGNSESLSLTIKCNNNSVDASNVSVRNASYLLREAVSATPKGEIYWKNVFIDLSFKNRWSNVYKGLKDFHDSDLDFKLLHNILFTNCKLYIMKLVDSPLCTFCKDQTETVMHLFVDCRVINPLWGDLITKLDRVYEIKIYDKWKQLTLLGTDFNHKRHEHILIDLVLNTFKKVVWTSRVSLLNGEKQINIKSFFHNSLRKKIDFLYHYFLLKQQSSQFWQLFTQGDVVLDCLEDDTYTYKFDI